MCTINSKQTSFKFGTQKWKWVVQCEYKDMYSYFQFAVQKGMLYALLIHLLKTDTNVELLCISILQYI